MSLLPLIFQCGHRDVPVPREPTCRGKFWHTSALRTILWDSASLARVIPCQQPAKIGPVCLLLRFRSAVEGFKKMCREKRFTAWPSRNRMHFHVMRSKFAALPLQWQVVDSQVRDFEYSKDGRNPMDSGVCCLLAFWLGRLPQAGAAAKVGRGVSEEAQPGAFRDPVPELGILKAARSGPRSLPGLLNSGSCSLKASSSHVRT